jgi:hypothetical protein
MHTRRSRFSAGALASTLILAGCAAGPQVRVDYDRTADFGKYRSYGFVEAVDSGAGEATSLVTQSLRKAAAREMEARGYTPADTPDLVINFKGRLEEKADIESIPAPHYGRAWGYRGYYGAPYGGWGGSQPYTRRYTVGTLVIDIVDRVRQQVVFQGATEDIVTAKMLENRDETISRAVADIFSGYPFVAGRSARVAGSDDK